MWLRLKQEDKWDGEIWNRRKDGSIFLEWLRIAVVRTNAGAIENYTATFSDISERKHAEKANPPPGLLRRSTHRSAQPPSAAWTALL